MLTALRRHTITSRHALIAALLLCASQALSVQHIHADAALEPHCAVCAATPQDDSLLPVAGPALATKASGATHAPLLELSPRAVASAATRARAPPTR